MSVEETTSSEVNKPKSTQTPVVSCGNCGRRIQPHQASIQIYNTRYKNNEHYHEDYRGCYESTRETPVAQLNKLNPWLNVALAGGMSVVFPHYDSGNKVQGQE